MKLVEPQYHNSSERGAHLRSNTNHDMDQIDLNLVNRKNIEKEK